MTEDQEGAICTTGFAVLRPKGIDSLTLAQLLKMDFVCMQVLRNNIGIAYPAIDEACLPNILLPISKEHLGMLETHSKAIAEAEEELDAMRSEFEEDITTLISNWEQRNF